MVIVYTHLANEMRKFAMVITYFRRIEIEVEVIIKDNVEEAKWN